MKELYVVNCCRTAIGSFGGALKNTPAVDLGAIVIKEALNRAGVKPEQVDEVMFGCILTAAQGQNVARQASIKAGIPYSVPAYTVGMVCGSGMKSMIEGARSILAGDSDVVVCGGTENGIIPISMAGFQNMKAVHMGEDPTAASIPFDARRSGFVMGEGAGCLVLESLTHAQQRGATILAEVAGYGASGDAYHITSPSPDGEAAAHAIRGAIEDAGLTPADVDYINAHGTSTPLNERSETLAIKKAFGEHAYDVVISSTKSMTGHMLGAAGAVEAIASALAVKEGIVPPTINYKEPDPDCDLDVCPNEARKVDLDLALSVSLGFGGHNACIAIRKVL